MKSLALRNVVANKARLALITLAVAIGVSFVTATFVFSDSLSQTFDELSTEINSDVDVEIRAINSFGSDVAVTDDIVDRIAATDGVTAVAAIRESEDIAPLGADGELVAGYPITLGWIDDDGLRGFDLESGAAPGPNQFVMSVGAADRSGFAVGDRVSLSTPTGLVERELAGTVVLLGGEAFDDQLTFLLMPLDDLRSVAGGAPDLVDAVQVSLDDTTIAADVQAALATDLGSSFEVRSARTVQEESAADFNSQIAILRNVLLGFAVISVFVSTMIIHNTFGVILQQRVRELGLLRAIGADGRQIRRSVLAEAMTIGLFASAVGLAAGVGLTLGLSALFGALGAPLPDLALVVSLRTVLVAFGVGVIATVVSAVGPANAASRMTPMAAMNGSADGDERRTLRLTLGALAVALGAAAAGAGLFASSGTSTVLALVGGGVALLFIGIAMVSPLLAGPVVGALGFPLARISGVSGTLARSNARRNRRRTANTAAALMIGLSLIATVLVVGESFKSHLATTLDETVSADFVVSNDFEPIAAGVATDMASMPELGEVMAVSEIPVDFASEVREAETLPLDALGSLFDLGIDSGELPDSTDAAQATAVLSVEFADELGLQVGDPIDVRFANGAATTFDVTALYRDTTLIDTGLLLDRSTVESVVALETVDWVAAGVASGAGIDAARTALDALSTEWPQIDVQTSTEYRETIEDQIDQLLTIVNVLLALSIIIALVGIALTLALSVFERTREIGLLRAVGMSARQVRRMVRGEAALIAAFGAVLGLATGLAYGWAVVTAMPDTMTSSVAVPSLQLFQLAAAGVIAGIVASILPARRAARLDVLAAISGRAA